MRLARAARPLHAALLATAMVIVTACAATAPPASGLPATNASAGPGSASPAIPVELRVYAAASLRNVVGALATAYEAGHPGTAVAVSTDSSAALAAKIEAGAPADVLLSADTRSPQRLVDAGLADGAVTIFAGNELALVVPADNPGGVQTPADLAKPGLKVIAAADEVPVTGYTRRLLDQLAELDGYPHDFAARVDANIVSREDNVGGIVAKVALGEGDAGIVYQTDARAADGVAAIPIPAGHNVEATYGAVALQGSSEPEAAAGFLGWLLSAEAQGILASFGFMPVA